MAKALFGHVVAPAELRVAEENAVLRAKVRRLERELEDLRAQRDAAIAHELLSLAGDSAEPALGLEKKKKKKKKNTLPSRAQNFGSDTPGGSAGFPC